MGNVVTMRVIHKASGTEMVINVSDFDSAVYKTPREKLATEDVVEDAQETAAPVEAPVETPKPAKAKKVKG